MSTLYTIRCTFTARNALPTTNHFVLMNFSHSRQGQHLIIELHGNLYDQLLAPHIEEITKEHLESADGNLIIDVSDLNHINSSGVNLLLKMLNAYKTNKRDVIIAGANSSITGVLTISKLHTIFGMTETVQQALEEQQQQTKQHS